MENKLKIFNWVTPDLSSLKTSVAFEFWHVSKRPLEGARNDNEGEKRKEENWRGGEITSNGWNRINMNILEHLFTDRSIDI